MQIIKSLFKLLIVFVCPIFSFAQSTTLMEGDKSEHFFERLDIKQQRNPSLILYNSRPLTRKLITQQAQNADSLNKLNPNSKEYALSAIDKYDLNEVLINNLEWIDSNKDFALSKKPFLNTFYKTKANFYEVDTKDFYLAVNPVIQQIQAKESGNDKRVYLNSKGLTLRGLIAKKVGFSFYLTDNQERMPSYALQRNTNNGYPYVPGVGYFKNFKNDITAYDYFENRGSFYFNVAKYFDFQFGYDKNFIGDGYRSLFLSTNSAPYLFLKFNMRIWKLNYQTIYMELINQRSNLDISGDYQFPKKYGVVHHLSLNATPWLNVGLFENVMFSRADHYDFSYLNPVIFLIAAQQQNGSPDKTTVGLDFKANVAHKAQVYGQLLFNEFVLNEITHYSRGWWANKQGVQLGVKYIDAFKIKNLDLQLEGNIVRPFTYTHNDSVSNYSNYNQPMAHPLGANFDEVIGIARYRPLNKLYLEAKVIAYRQGLDSAGENFGSNIFLDYTTRPRDYGFSVGSGVLAKCVNLNLSASYEIKENLFIDAVFQTRTYKVDAEPVLNNNSTLFSLGIRWNATQRMYDY
ncbi:hypothetical protein [Ferruginibacter albus]|uniref:hypothetical protein n=1 Tax=Ferruginibacter albus TaxID=2875540 RepID=UPI001CC64493|nr:hypothetical protein [Ferruginibacter albus]UAY52499.1 hypothetical protein K9M53_02125 [Ferruginibacter albus]